MKQIRIGNDVRVRWAILRNAAPVELTGKQLTVTLTSALLRREVTDFQVQGNVVSFVFRGSDQRRCGVYSLTLTERDEHGGQRVVDAIAAFELVPMYPNADGCCCSNDVEVANVLDLPADGESAYEIALRNGFQGTEEEWLRSLQVPAEKAMEIARNAIEQIQADSEAAMNEVKDAVEGLVERYDTTMSVVRETEDGKKRLKETLTGYGAPMEAVTPTFTEIDDAIRWMREAEENVYPSRIVLTYDRAEGAAEDPYVEEVLFFADAFRRNGGELVEESVFSFTPERGDVVEMLFKGKDIYMPFTQAGRIRTVGKDMRVVMYAGALYGQTLPINISRTINSYGSDGRNRLYFYDIELPGVTEINAGILADSQREDRWIFPTVSLPDLVTSHAPIFFEKGGQYVFTAKRISIPKLKKMFSVTAVIGPELTSDSLDFPELEDGGTITIVGPDEEHKMDVFSFPKLKRVNRIQFPAKRIELPELEESTLYVLSFNRITKELYVPKLRKANIVITSCDSIESLDLPELEEVNLIGNTSSNKVRFVNAPKLKTITGNNFTDQIIRLGSNEDGTDFNFSELTSVPCPLISGGVLKSLKVPKLANYDAKNDISYYNSIALLKCEAISDLTLPSLEVASAFGFGTFKTVNLPKLYSCPYGVLRNGTMEALHLGQGGDGVIKLCDYPRGYYNSSTRQLPELKDFTIEPGFWSSLDVSRIANKYYPRMDKLVEIVNNLRDMTAEDAPTPTTGQRTLTLSGNIVYDDKPGEPTFDELVVAPAVAKGWTVTKAQTI